MGTNLGRFTGPAAQERRCLHFHVGAWERWNQLDKKNDWASMEKFFCRHFCRAKGIFSLSKKSYEDKMHPSISPRSRILSFQQEYLAKAGMN